MSVWLLRRDRRFKIVSSTDGSILNADIINIKVIH